MDALPDIVAFNISETDAGYDAANGPAGAFTIRPSSALPTAIHPVTIDGYTQPGAAANTNPTGQGLNTVLRIELDGSLAGPEADGLTLTADSTLRGLVVNRFGGAGVRLEGACNTVAGCFVGTDVTGTVALGNGTTEHWAHAGIMVWRDSQDNVIGTNGDGQADEAERNLVSGNTRHGINIVWSPANKVAGNLIGTDVSGTGVLPNGDVAVGVGVERPESRDNVIGTDGDGVADEAERNVVSGYHRGVVIGNGANHNVVAGNYIGTEVTGKTALGNFRGVSLTNTLDPAPTYANLIGTNGDGVSDDLERNLISGNTGHGVGIWNAGADQNVVAGNYIGTDVSGTVAIGNGYTGVLISDGAQGNRVGTTGDGQRDDLERNLISANGRDGVAVAGAGTNGNAVAGNYIGTDVTGTVAMGNGSRGVRIAGGAQSNLIGTNGDGVADVVERNLISGNLDHGVLISGPATDFNVVAGNYVGTDVSGSVSLGNGLGVTWGEGVRITGGARFNLIGTDGSDDPYNAAERNVISGNSTTGLSIIFAGTDYNVVAGNFIGTEATGNSALPNGSHGVIIGHSNPRGNLIGTDGDGVADHLERNVISGNTKTGIGMNPLEDTETEPIDNGVVGNFIGTDASGTATLGNGWFGVSIINGESNYVERNVISGNGRSGVSIRDPRATGNGVHGNLIGTDVTGQLALGNVENGIRIADGAYANQIGGSGTEANLVAFNGGSGVIVVEDAVGNAVQGNSIHSNGGLGIDLGDDGPTANDAGDADTGPNQLQNYPEISAAHAGDATRIAGSLGSTPGTAFTIDFYASAPLTDVAEDAEGERHLGSATVTTDVAGLAALDVTLTAATNGGEFITATATDPDGNTSEFSAGFRSALPIEIDVKPGSDPNAVNVASNGVIAVAILTTADFDASWVDAGSVVFAGASPVQSALEDVDGDGDVDMILHFAIEDTDLAQIYGRLLDDDLDGDGVLDSNHQLESVSLTGWTADEYFQGFDELDLFLSGKNLRELLDQLAAEGQI